MRYTKLGSTSIDISVIGLGTWAIGGWWWGGTNKRRAVETIHAAVDLGINLIDTAPAYGKGLSEEIVGQAIKSMRDKVVIATKCGLRWDDKKGEYFFDYNPGEPVYRYLGKESIEKELDDSLRRLGTDYIDLYQSHWQDPTTPISETMETFLKLKEKGKIRAIGISNASLNDIKQYLENGIIDSDQEEYNLLNKKVEDEILPWCRENNITFLSYGSLDKGLLSGKMSPDRKLVGDDQRAKDPKFQPDNIDKINNLLKKYLEPIADKNNAKINHIPIAWLIKNKNVVALCGARSIEHVTKNTVAADIELDQDDCEKINAFIREYR